MFSLKYTLSEFVHDSFDVVIWIDLVSLEVQLLHSPLSMEVSEIGE